jgi:hypothetical protein
MWTCCIWFRIGISEGACEHGNESSGSLKGGYYFFLTHGLSPSQKGLCSVELVV